MKVETILGKCQRGDTTLITLTTIIDGDATVVGEQVLLSMPTKHFPECDVDKDSWPEIVAMVRQGSWYKRGEQGRIALDRENSQKYPARPA